MFQITVTQLPAPPRGDVFFHIQSSLQVGSGLGFTDDTKTRISDALCQDKWQAFFKQRNLKPAIYLLTHIQKNQNQVSEVREAFGGKVNGKQRGWVDYFERNLISLYNIHILFIESTCVNYQNTDLVKTSYTHKISWNLFSNMTWYQYSNFHSGTGRLNGKVTGASQPGPHYGHRALRCPEKHPSARLWCHDFPFLSSVRLYHSWEGGKTRRSPHTMRSPTKVELRRRIDLIVGG